MNGCCVERCNVPSNIEVHYISRLHCRVHKDGKISVFDSKGRRVKGVPVVLTSINRKQLSFYHEHHLGFESGKYYSLDYSKLNFVLNRNIQECKLPMPKDGELKLILDGFDDTLEKIVHTE